MRRLSAVGLIALSLLLIGGNLYAATCRLSCALATLPGAEQSAPPAAAPAVCAPHTDDDCSAVPLRATLHRPAILPNRPIVLAFIHPPAAVSSIRPAFVSPRLAAASSPVLPHSARSVPLRI